MIVTFYSYKGGTGRTQLLSNLAAYFCFYQDKKVLMIDWDLEAPGLHFYFKKDELQHKGLLDLMSHYCDIMQQEITVPEDRIEQEFKEGLFTYVKKDIAISKSGRGRIDLMPAGYYDDTYTRKANHFDWVKFYESLDGGSFIELLKKYLKAQDYDYIFIDSRTGISDYSGICNIQIPDANVVVIAPTDQNVKGCKRVIKRITEAEYVKDQQQRYPIIIPILSRLDPSNNKQRGTWIKKFRTEFRAEIDQLIKLSVNLLPDKKHREIITDDIVEEYIKTTLIEYQTDISYGEKILFYKEKKEIEITTTEEQFLGIAGFIEAFKDYPFVDSRFLPFSFNQKNSLFKQSIQANKNEYNTFYYAVFLHENNKLEAASNYYKQVLFITKNESIKTKAKNNFAIILKKAKQFDRAESLYKEILEKNENPDVLLNLGNLYFDMYRFDEAEKYYKEALVKLDMQTINTQKDEKRNVANIKSNLGNTYYFQNRFNDAEKVYLQALKIFRNLGKDKREDHLSELGMVLNNLGLLYRAFHEYDKAEDSYKEAIDIYLKLSQTNQKYLSESAITLDSIGSIYSLNQTYDKAEKVYEQSLVIRRSLVEINPETKISLATTLSRLGSIYKKLSKPDKAKKMSNDALEIRKLLAKNNEPSSSELATVLNDLGISYSNVGDFDNGQKEFNKSLEIYRELAKAYSQAYLPSVANSLSNLAELYRNNHKLKEGEESLIEAVSTQRKLINIAPNTYRPIMANTLSRLGVFYRENGKYDEAEQTQKEALNIINEFAKSNPKAYEINLADIHFRLFNLYGLHFDDAKQAKHHGQQALDIYQKYPKNRHATKNYILLGNRIMDI